MVKPKAETQKSREAEFLINTSFPHPIFLYDLNIHKQPISYYIFINMLPSIVSLQFIS